MKKLIFLFAIILTSCYDYEVMPSEKQSKFVEKKLPDSVVVQADTIRRKCGV